MNDDAVLLDTARCSLRGQASLLLEAFSADEKKPAEAGFSQDHIDSLSAAILAMVDHP
jgi:hypothetical protein